MSSDLASVRQSEQPLDRRMVAHDLWPRRLLERRAGISPTLPARVFWPADVGEVQLVVREARRMGAALVPFGAGSGVCAGISPDQRAWVLDTKRLDMLEWLDEERQLCRVGAGMNGERLERALNARGYSLGHFPSSIYCSTAGGWVACRSAGQLSSRYGKIEDLVHAVEFVDGRGERIRADLGHPDGPGLLRLIVGSEGALGVVCSVEFMVHRLATHRYLRGLTFPDLSTSLTAARTVLQAAEAPSVLRIYDPLDTLIAGTPTGSAEEPDHIALGGIAHGGLEHSGPDRSAPQGHEDDDDNSLFGRVLDEVERVALFRRPRPARRLVGELMTKPLLANALLDRLGKRCKMIIGLEGDADELGRRAPALRERLIALGGRDLGEGPGAKWLLHRHRVSYKMSRAFAAGGWVDTMEVSLGWDGVEPLYRAVREALRDVAVVMCHFSHAYVDGCSLYFTFAGGGAATEGPRSGAARYDIAWERALHTVRKHGAAASHHHGVGRSKIQALRRSPAERTALAAVKTAFDPDGIFNPGVLDLGAPTSSGRRAAAREGQA